jgi:hypothetical protein
VPQVVLLKDSHKVLERGDSSVSVTMCVVPPRSAAHCGPIVAVRRCGTTIGGTGLHR